MARPSRRKSAAAAEAETHAEAGAGLGLKPARRPGPPSPAELLRRAMEQPVVAAVLLLLWALALLLPGINQFPVADRDEAKFARAAVEMAERDNWLVPTFNNDFVRNPDKELRYELNPETGAIRHSDYRFDKPVGVYWLLRGSLALFGEKDAALATAGTTDYLPTARTDAALRLPSILSSWVVALVILGIGRQMFSKKAGFWAAFAWLSSAQVLIHGRLIVADMPMIAAVAASFWAAWNLLQPAANPNDAAPARERRPWANGWWWLWSLSLAWGFLVKGPIAWAVPVVALLLLRWVFLRQPLRWGRLAPVSTLVLALGLVAAWAIPANLATDWNYAKEGLGLHVLERGTKAMNGRGYLPLLPYLISTPLSLLPWGALLPFALLRRADEEKRDPRRAFLLAWLFAPLLIFGLYATQLPHYLLPGFPAFFLLLTRAGWPRVSGRFNTIWLTSVFILVLALGLALFGLALHFKWNPGLIDLKSLLLSVGCILTLFAAAAVASQLRRPVLPTLILLLLIGLPTHELATRLRRSNPTLALAEHWERFPSATLRAFKYQEPSLVYYSGREWTLSGSETQLQRWLTNIDDQVVVVLTKRWKLDRETISNLFHKRPVVPAEDRAPRLNEIAKASGGRFQVDPREGYNVAQTAWVETFAIFPHIFTAAEQEAMLRSYSQGQSGAQRPDRPQTSPSAPPRRPAPWALPNPSSSR